ncbi:MAG: macro domain-containing protein [Deltaproteobacteria bacterium]|nr:macro domain-containing protein [Deltaproteobacteria bacterium]
MSDELRVKQGVIQLAVGDITELPVEGIVYYARPDLVLGSGFGGVITAKGGPKIQEELKKFGKANTTDVVITSAGDLKAKYILHAVGPRFQEEDLEEKLRRTMGNVLRKAEESRIQSLAFPAMGAGFYGVPLEVCARETLEAVKRHLEASAGIREVVFCLRDSHEYKKFLEHLQRIR